MSTILHDAQSSPNLSPATKHSSCIKIFSFHPSTSINKLFNNYASHEFHPVFPFS